MGSVRFVLQVLPFLKAIGQLIKAADGRRTIYLWSLPIYIVASPIVGLSTNIYQLTLFRGIQSFGVCSFINVGAGTVMGVFEPEKRGFAFGMFAAVSTSYIPFGFRCRIDVW